MPSLIEDAICKALFAFSLKGSGFKKKRISLSFKTAKVLEK
jgi:hypothetical protein